MISQPLTYLKALVSAACQALLPWLIGALAAWTLSKGLPMPESAQAALAALLGGLAVYWTPNAEPKQTEADRIKELEEQVARLQAAGPKPAS